MPTAEEITRHHDPDPDENPWVHGRPAPVTVTLVAYDPSWPDRYADTIRTIYDRLFRAAGLLP